MSLEVERTLKQIIYTVIAFLAAVLNIQLQDLKNSITDQRTELSELRRELVEAKVSVTRIETKLQSMTSNSTNPTNTKEN